jgi:hypothetical protein
MGKLRWQQTRALACTQRRMKQTMLCSDSHARLMHHAASVHAAPVKESNT